MELDEFIYQYVAILFSTMVKERVLIESWEAGDFEARNGEYVDNFKDSMEKYLKLDVSEAKSFLKEDKRKLVTMFNSTMERKFKEMLKKHGVPEGTFEDFRENFMAEDINVKLLERFRTFEEAHYSL